MITYCPSILSNERHEITRDDAAKMLRRWRAAGMEVQPRHPTHFHHWHAWRLVTPTLRTFGATLSYHR